MRCCSSRHSKSLVPWETVFKIQTKSRDLKIFHVMMVSGECWVVTHLNSNQANSYLTSANINKDRNHRATSYKLGILLWGCGTHWAIWLQADLRENSLQARLLVQIWCKYNIKTFKHMDPLGDCHQKHQDWWPACKPDSSPSRILIPTCKRNCSN